MKKKTVSPPSTEKKAKQKKFDYNAHWKGMPEFTQNDLKPIKQLIVNFASKEDMHKFSKLVGQLVTAKTRSIWFPENTEETALDKRWSKSKSKK